MILNNILHATGNRVVSTSDYIWHCFGDNAVIIEFKDMSDLVYSSVVYNSSDLEIFLISIEVPGQPQAFRWVNPEWQAMYLDECKTRGVDPDVAWDLVNFTNIESEETILEYLKDIGEGYYDNLPIVEPIIPPEEIKPFIMDMPGTIGGAKLVFNNEIKEYKVSLDLRLGLDITATSMDDALEKARHWQKTSKMSWGEGNDVIWNDSCIVKETVEQRKEW
jgi:hypothetical protein